MSSFLISYPGGVVGASVASFSLPNTSKAYATYGGVVSNLRGPNDALAFPVISFSGLQNGTEVRVIRFFGTSSAVEQAGFESYTGTETLTIPFFGDGNSTYQFQLLSIDYVNLSFSFPVPRNDVTLPIVQQIERNYNNPA